MYRWSPLLILVGWVIGGVHSQLGDSQTQVPWRAGHVSAFLDPYVIVYGGTEDTNGDYSNAANGTTSLWVWDSRNGSWYHPQLASSTQPNPQIFFGATKLPSSGQMLIVGGNSTSGMSLQKLDTNSWSWSFPSSSTTSPSSAAFFSITLINNTIYTYGGASVDANGHPQTNAVLNSLYALDSNSFAWTSGSNGDGIMAHSTCYVQSCNCLITFGGTKTGQGADASANVIIYDLTTKSWNLQVSVSAGSSGAPGGSRMHTANCLKDKMIVYGGGTQSPVDSDVWILDASQYPSLTWQRQDVSNKGQGPGARMGHTSVVDESNQKMYIFGGWGGRATGDSNMYMLDMENWSWTRIATTGIEDSNKDGSSTSNHTGAIAGGVVGGVVGLALIAGLFLLWRRRQRRRREEDNASEKTDEPDYYARHPHYWTNGDQNGSLYELHDDGVAVAPMSPFPQRKRASKALTHSTTMRDSTLGVRSELGDMDHVMTGVLQEMDGASDQANYSSTTHSFRNSRHNSKVLLVPDSELRNAQNPEEIARQKPNEFSMPASRLAKHNKDIPIDHHNPQSLSSLAATVGSPTNLTQIGFDNHRPSTPLATSLETSNNHQDMTTTTTSLSPLVNMLPKRYQADSKRDPIIGPVNSILYVNKIDTNAAESALEKEATIKWFGRREAWERECRTLIRLKSAHVVELLEVLTIQDENVSATEDDETRMKYCTVMERLEETLGAVIQQARSDNHTTTWNHQRKRDIARNIVECLILCHSRGVAFCDLKPSNIMHRQGEPWKLIDFEASRTIGEECVGVITPRYCPPEVARATTYGLEGANGVVATPSVDLWALGCVIYELETKHALFASNIKDGTILHFVSHPSSATPILNNGLRWDEHKELYIPNFERNVGDPHARELITMLLKREPAERGRAADLLDHPYFNDT
ncbi:hypothetical protein O0I10_001803 [Lichtheimia ornata]|uniref:Protein kinase domain-containing protein n=1 Tax=Lichtheimia ornata TaxID=688661 RepID=A0AAD7VD28_9FUNG|nr:uncharacterized protein O0I10_001803 [Lichtheimia ornata]KAJ8662111.1 hypothetical protein O0I10_001803 [Lichtheimia ornata]